MREEPSCLQQVAGAVLMQYEDLHRQAGALRKLSKSVSKQTAKTGGVNNPKFAELLASAAGDDLRHEVREDQQGSDRQRIEEGLREREELYRLIADFSHDWELWLDQDEVIRYCSPSCQKVTGYAVTDFEYDSTLLRRIVYPEDLARYDQHRHVIKKAKKHDEIEFRIIHADGTVRWISQVCRPVYKAAGEYIGTRGSNRDITKRKLLGAEMIKARNLESLGNLAGGIAHDFNNLFQGLLGNISLAKMCLSKESEAFSYLANAENVHAQATKLTSQLTAFSSGGAPQRIEIPLAPYIRQTVTANPRCPKLAVVFDIAGDLWPVKIDPSQFSQVIDNLFTNACDAMASGGKILIRAINEKLPLKNMPHPLPPGNYVQISIKDQGGGIRESDLPRIFDPYFSTKRRCAQKGMGLGLALCNTIVRKSGGAITVETEPDQGSTFRVFLPAVAIATDKMAIKNKLTGNGPRILIMDDEAEVSEVATRYLTLHGYRVDAAANGDAAISAYQGAREHDDPYAAVVLDLAIPGGLGGEAVFSILKATDPEVKAIVSSGYTADPALIDYAAHGFIEVLVKPYQPSNLKEVLDRLV